jgi:23S rRNA (guanosine2251-2'-O)-methyltransferase
MSTLDKVSGLHSVQSFLKTSPQRVHCLHVFQGRRDQKLQKILDLARQQNIKINFVDKKQLDELCEGNHQGIMAEVTPGKTLQEPDLYQLVKDQGSLPLILVLDGITDPHNLGACLRSADAAGATAVVIPKDNSAGLTEVARKVASGAAEHIPLIAVTNLARTLKKLQELGLWVTGLAGEAEQTLFESDLSGPRVLVMGAEGSGMRRLTRETCDTLVKIPMLGHVSSLNVSVATGIVLFETLRQRG